MVNDETVEHAKIAWQIPAINAVTFISRRTEGRYFIPARDFQSQILLLSQGLMKRMNSANEIITPL